MCSDVERTIRFYQGLLGFPLVEIFENRDYQGSTHLFFDIGLTIRWPSSTSRVSTSAPTPRCWVACTTSPSRSTPRSGPPPREVGGSGCGYHIDSEISMYFSDPDGVRLELIAEELGSLYGTPLH